MDEFEWEAGAPEDGRSFGESDNMRTHLPCR